MNNIPHLGNLIQVLSADVFARFCRLRGFETLYICGSDEYGTATATRALAEGIEPRALCDRYYKIHSDIYKWFNISFDKFGRTSTPEHTEITQKIFLQLYRNGYIFEREIEQLYSEKSRMFLPDRYILGTCPHCNYDQARGDQCESCGKLLESTELINPISAIDDSRPIARKTKHLYIDLPKMKEKLLPWMREASQRGGWARNAISMTEAWLRDGLRERAITRDLKWGIPVPLEGFQDKVFYVWFDAPIGYISITASHTKDWRDWWQNPDEVELFQFIGKDNIPFHTVVFPSSLLGSGERWTMLHHMSSTEYLNYEGRQFSKTRGVGVFGDDARATGIPADIWRFYMLYNRPDTSDFNFSCANFRQQVNCELIGNFGNLINRTVAFINRYCNGYVAAIGDVSDYWQELWGRIAEHEKNVEDYLTRCDIRRAFREIFFLASLGNRVFQEGEPWKRFASNPDEVGVLLANLIYLVRDLAIVIAPYLPETSKRIASLLKIDEGLDWNMLGKKEGITSVAPSEILFTPLDADYIHKLGRKFAGKQVSSGNEDSDRQSIEEMFKQSVSLIAAKVLSVSRHPNADMLYLLDLDDGRGQDRRIVSGLADHYSEEELKGRTIILVDNLKPANLRGIRSEGMLLAAEKDDVVDVLFVDHASPGSRVALKGDSDSGERTYRQLKKNRFADIPIEARTNTVYVGLISLECAGKPVCSQRVSDGSVG